MHWWFSHSGFMTRKFLLKYKRATKGRGVDTMHITPLTPSMVGTDASKYHGRQKAQDRHILKDTSWGEVEKRSGGKVWKPQDSQGTETKLKPVSPNSCLKSLRKLSGWSAFWLKKATTKIRHQETPTGILFSYQTWKCNRVRILHVCLAPCEQ